MFIANENNFFKVITFPHRERFKHNHMYKKICAGKA